MLQRDYIMRMIQLGVQAIIMAITNRREDEPDLACETIEQMLGSVSDMDPDVLLALSPESLGTILNLGDAMNDSVAEVVVRGLVLESDILAREKNDMSLSKLRMDQARGVAEAFCLDFDSISSVIDAAGARELEEAAIARSKGL